jgi:hypothetical protein
MELDDGWVLSDGPVNQWVPAVSGAPAPDAPAVPVERSRP